MEKHANFARGIQITEYRPLQHSDIDSLSAHYPGLTGIYTLAKAQDAFAARLAMIEAAQTSLAFQYYIWRRDVSGTALLNATVRAADRGVRVRMLLDDLHTSGLDATLSALNEHRCIEIRLFNAFRLRRLRLANLLFSFGRLNRRMHNKTLIADQRVLIVGGRNIGDDYFTATGPLFADLDVLAIGAVVADADRLFDQFWNSALAVRAESLLRRVSSQQARRLAADTRRIISGDETGLSMKAALPTPLSEFSDSHSGRFRWAPARLLADDPYKTRRTNASMLQTLMSLFGHPQNELLLLSAYFVPSLVLEHMLADCAKSGVDVQVVTNAFEATDVPMVHAAYSKKRRGLLAAGVRLYELRSTTQAPVRRALGKFGNGSMTTSTSASALHAKVFMIDGRRVFVGSFNIDPRSRNLNTEQGIVMDSEVIANEVRELVDTYLIPRSYALRLGVERGMWWKAISDEKHFDREPGTTVWSRTLLRLIARLPIGWLM